MKNFRFPAALAFLYFLAGVAQAQPVHAFAAAGASNPVAFENGIHKSNRNSIDFYSAGDAAPYISAALYAAITNNTIGNAQTICFNTVPAALTGSSPAGGNGVYTYQWQSSTVSAAAGFTNIAAATNINFSPGTRTVTTWYRRIVASGAALDTTSALQVTVTPVINHASNTISSAQSICSNTVPAIITGSNPAGGDGVNYSYVWQSSPDNASWATIPAASGISYAPAALTSTAYYRRIVNSGGCSDPSASVKITVNPVITNNTISANQSICSAQAAQVITGSTPSGGAGAFVYQWLSSTVSATTGFTVAAGAVTGINYSPGTVSQTTWYKRLVSSGGCIDTSSAVQVMVFNSAPGNPALFGNNVWNVYAYSDAAFTAYAGYYTEPALSFLSTSRFASTQSPSNAAGYQGCLVPTANFSASFKRTNFTPAVYQVDLSSIDDNFYLIINGTQVYSRGCCITPPAVVSNIWTGFLGAADQVEIRWTQGAGPSQIGANFNIVTAPVLLPGTIGNNQSACTGELPAAAFVSIAPATGCSQITYQWQRSTDSAAWTNIPSATAPAYAENAVLLQNTWYRRVATDACNNTAASQPVKITVYATAPGDPAVFGDNVWNAYAYNFPPGNYNFSAAVYKGYYTEPSLSFNSTSRWPSGGSPSVASGYKGCYVAGSNNWVVYKRTNIATGVYQVDIPAHDDYAYLYINGVLVFQHAGCCDAHTNVWTGAIAASDVVEYRVMQAGGASYGAVTFTPVTPLPLTTGGVIAPSQSICAGNIPSLPLAETIAPAGGCTVKTYKWESSADNGVTWNFISGATAASYTIPNSIYTQTLYRRTITDYCGNTAVSVPDTIFMNASSPGNPAVFGNNTWNAYCFQDINYAIYAGYYTEPQLSFNTTSRYSAYSPPSAASGYQGCQLLNTYYSVSMKRTGFTPGLYQLDITGTDDYAILFINGVQVASLTCCTPVNNVWTGNIAAADEIELRWRNNAGPGNTGLRFTLMGTGTLTGGTIAATNPNLCYNDVPIITSSTVASGGCFVNYSWESSTDGGTSWNSIAGAAGAAYTAGVSPATNIQYRRVATDICGATAYSNTVNFVQGAGAVGNPSVFGNGQWNVYAYAANGSSFAPAVYLGYYTEPLLSFNSMNRWSSNGSPSDATGYQGCLVDHQNHWVSYRRTNFTAAVYQLDITNHDDWVYVYVNGNLVFSHVGCCDAHTNIWTGPLGPSDQVEFRWYQGLGGTNGGMTLTPVTPPVFINGGTIGANQNICYNSIPSAFSNIALAADSCFITYQWQYSTGCSAVWTDIAGATGSSFTSAAPLAANTCYRRVANDACGNSAVSNTVTVTVSASTINAPVISSNQTICSGAAPAAFTITTPASGGNGSFSYQWQSSPDNIVWTNIAGATAASLSPGVLLTGRYYRLNLTDCGGSLSATSNALLVTVNQPPVITVQPANAVACAGGNTSIAVTATGTALVYQWQLNTGTGWNNITNGGVYSNAATSSLSITGAAAGMNGYQYRVIVSGTCSPAVNSAVSTLSIGANPGISLQPANSTSCIGSTVNFTVVASGSGLSYQWQQKIGAGVWTNQTNTGIYSGANTATLTLTGITAAVNGYNYRCIISSSCAGLSTSGAAVLTVTPAIVNNIAADQAICAGGTPVALTGNTGTGYTYLWQSSTVSAVAGFVPAAGANTGAAYSPGPVTSTTYFQRIVTSGGCTSISSPVTVAYNAATISISGQPVSKAVCQGGTATYTVTASGPGTVNYQWFQYNGVSWTALTDGGMYSGSLTNSLTITGVSTAMNNYRYYVKIIPSGCSASTLNSGTVSLNVYTDPVITSSSPDIHTCEGNAVAVNVAAAGVALSYQWQQNTGSGWNNLPNYGVYSNVYTASLSIYPITASLSGTQYRCVVSGSCNANTAVSGTTTITVDPPVTNNSIASSQILCSGTPAPFTGSTPSGGNGVYAYQWYQDIGAGWVAIPGATAVNYAAGSLSQTTRFTRNASSGSCGTNTAVAVSVTINPPTSVVDPSSTTVCTSSTAQLTVSGTGTGLGYQWQVNTGSGLYTDIAITNIQYSGANTSTLTVNSAPAGFNGYQFRCVVTGNCGPAAVISNAATLTVVDPASMIAGQPANVAACQGGNAVYSVTTNGAGLTYRWYEKIGSGTFNPIVNGGIYSGAATVTLVLTGVTASMNANQYMCVVAAGSCSVNSLPAVLTVSTPPSATIAYAGSPYCATGTATVIQTGKTGGAYSAAAGLSVNTTTGEINLAASTPGTYTVTYSFSNGSCNGSTNATIIIQPLPAAGISYAGSPYCVTGTATVTQTGQAGGVYSAAAGLSINTATGEINLAASTPGTYTVTYQFSNGTCSNTTTSAVTINALPSAGISYAGSPYCAVGTAAVTQTGQAGGAYSAAAGLSINAATGEINLAASTPGTYTVTYQFSDGACSNTTTAPVTINALPAAAIAYTGSPYCSVGTAVVAQTGQAGGVYSAAAGLSINTSTGEINLAASTPGTYTVTYQFSNGTCSNTTTTAVTINALPTAGISYAGSPYCAVGTAAVTQTGQAGGAYSAAAGLSINAATGEINLAASTPGTYTVTYQFSDGTCSNTTTGPVTINALPTAAIAYTGSPYCAVGTAAVTQTGQAGGVYSAAAGLSINTSTGEINLAASTPGTYTVSYQFSGGACTNTTTTAVTINALPTAVISYTGSPYCPIGTATVTQTGEGGGAYSAAAGLSINAATGEINLAASTPGTYTVIYSFSNGVCSNTASATVVINAVPSLIVHQPSAVCVPGTVDITVPAITAGSTAGLTFTYFMDAAGTVALSNPAAVGAGGTYYIRATTAAGCSVIRAVTVIVNPLPLLSVHNPAAVCMPQTIDLRDVAVTAGTTGASLYGYWSDAGGSVALGNPSKVTSSGTYYITAVSGLGCSTTPKAVQVVINPNPVLSVSNNVEICKGSSTLLTALSPGSSVNWVNAGAGSTISVTPPVTTTYSAIAVSSSGCTAMASVTVKVDDFNLLVTASPNPVLAGTTLNLNTSGNFGYSVLSWSPQSYFTNQAGAGQTITITDTSVVFKVAAQTAIGCRDTASISITVLPNTRDFFIPNAFTPNNDGNNDVFRVYGSSVKELHLLIFNQWGQPIYEVSAPGKGWDGTLNGRPQPTGVYLYAVKAVLYNGNVYQKKGTVELVR